jgi:hypothetical protein
LVNDNVGLHQIADLMQSMGAVRIVYKLLSNNDNSKNQIYFGSDFSVIQMFPSGEVSDHGVGAKGAVFKAPVNFNWISRDGESERALGAQFILYPGYPEVRLSGILKGCRLAPSELMQPPTRSDREERGSGRRCMVLGIAGDSIVGYVSAWGSKLSQEAEDAISGGTAELAATVFYEFRVGRTDSRIALIARLNQIWKLGPVRSCRLNSKGERIEYRAKNGAGYTLESLFGISPNGISEPDFMDWEIKAHSGGAVTLMTPEPDEGTYLESLEIFMRVHATSSSPIRMDFASRHSIGLANEKSRLTMLLEGYDPIGKKIIDPAGGLTLRDVDGNLAAGWSFSKLISHWKRKHAKTCFVSYSAEKSRDVPYYSYGPLVVLGIGTDLEKFLEGLYSSTIYYDPGINMKLADRGWVPKKRNQFRVAWKGLDKIYATLERIDVSDIE